MGVGVTDAAVWSWNSLMQDSSRSAFTVMTTAPEALPVIQPPVSTCSLPAVPGPLPPPISCFCEMQQVVFVPVCVFSWSGSSHHLSIHLVGTVNLHHAHVTSPFPAHVEN